MKILNLECSATPASVAITENEEILASSFVNVKLTHSQTLMPMVENTLAAAKLTIADIEGIAITNGPGSFTGVRIGISALKGLAAPKNLPCVAVSTLMAMAQNYIDCDCIVCAVMDARCNQVYNALFEVQNGTVSRLCEDRALLCDELAQEIKKLSQKTEKCVIIVGDGAQIFYPFVKTLQNVRLSAPARRYQNAVGVGAAAHESFLKGKTISSKELLPFYLRLPQAERELKA
ncbi:MAG: tRNA (adenosine(37)-N6)-threonylcarbamoyltransferase complex dimerization subunit type 1 TsaB, partial [Ruminococcaceae bacterium]|nr:tRNA (adenosine(37)-N6)-threonylcarbamoyltransferase complex dimerization subunit type 1 TsaB [Oscillospiraceae bacterium]